MMSANIGGPFSHPSIGYNRAIICQERPCHLHSGQANRCTARVNQSLIVAATRPARHQPEHHTDLNLRRHHTQTGVFAF
jgi:hypothetical protein